MYAPRARVLVSLNVPLSPAPDTVRRGIVVSKVNDVDVYVVRVAGRRITISGAQLKANVKGKGA